MGFIQNPFDENYVPPTASHQLELVHERQEAVNGFYIYWGSMGIMEKKMEILYWGYIYICMLISGHILEAL